MKINARLVKRILLIVYHVKKGDPLNNVYVKMDIMRVDSLFVFNARFHAKHARIPK